MVLAQDLRDAVLQAALQGKLTEQLEADSSVDVLLQDVKAKKKKLIDKGDIKREKVSFSINKEDIPFEIPSTWKWTRMQDILDVRDGTHDSPTYQISGVPFITSKNLIDGKIDFDNVKYISQEDADFFNKRSKVNKGDILMAMIGSIGKPVLVDVNKEFAIKNVALLKKVPNTDVNMNYVLLLLYYSEAIMKNQSLGGVQKFVSLTYLRKYIVPLPPIEEQQRIVDRVNELMKKIDEYEKVEKELVDLEQRFPDDMKNALLQAAFSGNLTRQLSTDTDVKSTLDIVKTEKSALVAKKKVKADADFPEISEDEKSFSIPGNWDWVRIGDVGIYKKGPFGSALTKSIFVPKSNTSIKVYEQKNAIQKDFSLGDYYISKDYYENKMKSFTVESGDIIVSCAGTIGETYVMPNNIELGIINQALMRMNIVDSIDTDYFLKYFDHILKKDAQKQSKGSAIKNIPPFNIFKKMLMPFPPIEEQQRIVKKLKQLLPLCEAL